MGVYIKGMEMPKDGVYWCEIGVADDIAMITIHGEDRNSFHLVPVPPHGRLIDADALTVKLKRLREYHSDGSKSGAAISNGISQCLDIINGKECPTVIEAEEGDT